MKYARERIVPRGGEPAGRIIRRAAARTKAFSTAIRGTPRSVFSLLQSSINFVEQVLDGQFPEFAIGHEFSENLLIALHAVDHEALEGFLEDVAELSTPPMLPFPLLTVTVSAFAINTVSKNVPEHQAISFDMSNTSS